MREFRLHHREEPQPTTSTKKKSKPTATDKDSDVSKQNELSKAAATVNSNDSGGGSDEPGSPDPFQPLVGYLPPVEQIDRQTPQLLAMAVRKHFNAQQLNEAETVAKFIYVARNSSSRGAVRTEGSAGDGNGWWMGSQGREIRKCDGGEVGFRLRFRPG